MQVCPSLPRSYRVKDMRKQLNDEVDVVALPNADGAYRPLKPALASVLEHEVCMYLFISTRHFLAFARQFRFIRACDHSTIAVNSYHQY